MRFSIRKSKIITQTFVTLTLLFSLHIFISLLTKNLRHEEHVIVDPKRIAIVAINLIKSKNKYIEAEEMNECYAIQHKYSLITLYDNRDFDITYNCKQFDFSFRRHCILANFAYRNKNLYDYILFIDSDMGVINPAQKLEKYLPKGKEEIIFYERYFNHEIAAGSFIFKNKDYARHLLHYIANYEGRLPLTYSCRDNVILHGAIVEYISSGIYGKEFINCNNFLSDIQNFTTCEIYVACMRWILNKVDENNNYYDYQSFSNKKIIILKKFSERRWVRDIWLTKFQFSEADFFLHDLKSEKFFYNKRFILDEFIFNRDLCEGPDFMDAWKYNKSAVTDTSTINKKLMEWKNKADRNFLKLLNLSNVENV
uniref:Nucleotide-diphospho-sugar transferase domain-containing protein n=1 Tax=Parastrongyloides trichosuri TaxID=131310 RepID=A0A0N4ZDZ7_PARTI